MLNDLRFAARQLRRAPTFALTAVLTLGLGIGAAAAVSSLVRDVLLAPLPYPHPQELVGVAFTFPHERPNAEQIGVAADFVRAHTNVFSSTAVMDDGTSAVNLSDGAGRAVQVNALRVSQGYFQTLEVMPELGRVFSGEEDRAHGARAVIVSDGLWQQLFQSAPNAIGRTIRVNEETFMVVGVMPADFRASADSAPGVVSSPDVWMPLQLSPSDPGYDGDNYKMIARLRPGVSLGRAQQELTALDGRFYEAHPRYKEWYGAAHALHQFQIWPLQTVVASESRTGLLVLFGAVCAILLLAWLNIAGLMMVRWMARDRELAMRSALGASAWGLVRVIAAEGVLIAIAAGTLAIVIAHEGPLLLLRSTALSLADVHGRPSAATEVGLVLTLAFVSVTVFSGLTAWLLLRRVGKAPRLGSNAVGVSASQTLFSKALLVLQVALGLVLLSSACTLMGTFLRLRALPPGIEPKQLSVFQVTLKGDRYAATRPTMQFVGSVLEGLQRTPGVEDVAAINGLPLDRGLNMGANPSDRRNLNQIVEFRTITPGYFRTMGMRLLQGRTITDDDRAGADRVVVIGATAARRWWPGRSPIGESIVVGNEAHWRVVGVVADAPMHSLVEEQGIVIYAPMLQVSDAMMAIMNGWFPITFAVRTAAHMNLGRVPYELVASADPEIPVARFTTMQAVIDSTTEAPRLFSMLSAGFSGFGLALAAIGIFGLLSYQVTRRTREIGVRMALGADRGRILRTTVMGGLAIASVGVVIGSALAWLVQPVIAHLMAVAGIEGGDAAKVAMSGVWATVLAMIAMLLAAAGASWIPARRAATIDPMQALRTE